MPPSSVRDGRAVHRLAIGPLRRLSL